MSDASRARGGVDRRGFFRIVGAGSAAAAAAGCGKTTEAILPFVIPPEHIVPGVASWFATVCRECPAGCGVLARSREGRVVKLEGNPDHPVSRGALCARGQAGLLGTYDPDRIPGPRQREGESWRAVSVADAQKLFVERVAAARQAGPGRIAMVTQLETGSLGRLLDDWQKAVGGRARVAYEPFAHEDLRAANRAVFGVDAIPYHAFDDAKTILSLGADFLETWISPAEHASGFRRAHALREGHTARVIHVEPRYSMTAANADEWIPSAPGAEAAIALALLRLVLESRQVPALPAKETETLAAAARSVDVEAVAKQSGVPAAKLRHLAEALVKGGPSLVVTGGVAVSGSTEGATAVSLLNYALGNVGRTIRFGPNSTLSRSSRYADLVALAKAMAQGEIAVLIVKDANPVFTLPARVGFAEALTKVPFVVSLSSHLDETTARAHLVIPDLTPLESWGDYSPREGVWGLMQPAMGPVPKIGDTNPDALDLPQLAAVRDALGRKAPASFPGVDTTAAGDLLLDTGRTLVPGSEKSVFQAKTFADYLRDSWRALAKSVAPKVAFETFWEAALRRGGYWADVPTAKVTLQPGVKVSPAAAFEGGATDPALLVVPSSRYYDGRSANKVWLHETPDPMTQLVYASWVEVPAETARSLGVQSGDVLRVESPHGAIEAPALVSETLAAGAVAIPTGLGHTAYGRFARGLGQSPYALLPAEPVAASGGRRWLGVRVRIQKTGRREKLASPAGVAEVDHAREIFETVELGEAVTLERGGKAPARANLPSMYPDLKYPQNRWGMTIDLDACTGCQACVVACQAENNVPWVGKGDIDYGRSLQWLRVERWWDRGGHASPPAKGHAGAAFDVGGVGVAHAAEAPATGRPSARFLPMLCQHCEVAPCEPVCPVFAAYHTADGLNAQVYNRCVGTRYCGNNCPYMVRRFNWYRYEWPAPMNLQLNPDVAVRDRGIMEKCTMCVQRIIAGRDRARDENRLPWDGEIQTACQQTCPTQAITFGDLKDGKSHVSRLSASPRGYHVLGDLGTKPAVTYLRKILRETHA